MDSKICLTPFTRDYNYSKLCDIWSSQLYFQKYKRHPTFGCKPSAFFVYSSKFSFRNSVTKTFNLVIDLIYGFKPIVSKIFPFETAVTTCSFAKDPFRPILFVGLESGDIYILNLDNLSDVQFYRPNFVKKENKPIIIADWIDDKIVLFSYFDQLFSWNIDIGRIDLVFESENLLEKTTYLTCSSFKPSLIALGLANGSILIFKEEKGQIQKVNTFKCHVKEICCLSFTVGNVKNHPLLASICSQGCLVVWNMQNMCKLFEDKCLKNGRSDNYKLYTCLFSDDLFDINQYKAGFKGWMDNAYYHKQFEMIKKENSNYFILFATDSNGWIHEFKVPKQTRINTENFIFQRKPFRMTQAKFTRVFQILMPRSFQINFKIKPQKGDSFQLANNNNYPIMLHVSNKNSFYNFITYDYFNRNYVENVPLLFNSISSIELNPVNHNLVAIPDTGGFITWQLPSFDNPMVYRLDEHRKGFFKKFAIRVTCFSWHPERDSIIAVGSRTGLILVYNILKNNPVIDSFQLDEKEYKSLYVYSIYWGPNILEDKKKFPDDIVAGLNKIFDYIYCQVDNRIVIINTATRAFLKFVDIADIYIEKQWTEICWKKDFRLLAVGSNEGTIDIFKHSMVVFYKLKHLVTIEVFKEPIHSICWHPIQSKPDENEPRFNTEYENVIAIASTQSVIKVIDLRDEIEEAEKEDQNESIDLPLMVDRVDYLLDDHKGRVYRMCFSTFKEMYLLSTSDDWTVKVWDLTKDINKYLVLTYYGHFSRTIAARWSLTVPDLVLSGGFDSIFSVWSVKDQTNEKPEPIKVHQQQIIKPLYEQYMDLKKLTEALEKEDATTEVEDESTSNEDNGEKEIKKTSNLSEVVKVEIIDEPERRSTITYFSKSKKDEDRPIPVVCNAPLLERKKLEIDNEMFKADDSLAQNDSTQEDDCNLNVPVVTNTPLEEKKKEINADKSKRTAKMSSTFCEDFTKLGKLVFSFENDSSTKLDDSAKEDKEIVPQISCTSSETNNSEEKDKELTELKSSPVEEIFNNVDKTPDSAEKNTLDKNLNSEEIPKVNDEVNPKKKTRIRNKNKESKTKSILVLQTTFDNSMSKIEHLKDVDKMIKSFEKKQQVSSEIQIAEDLDEHLEKFADRALEQEININTDKIDSIEQNKKEPKSDNSFLLYGDNEDMLNLAKLEADDYLKRGELESAQYIKLLSGSPMQVIDEARESNTLTDTLVAMSSSISLNYYQKTVLDYVEQLINNGKIVKASTYLLSLLRIKEAMDVLIKYKLYKEALMIAKTRFANNQNIYVTSLTKELAYNYAAMGNYESEAKCWLSIDYYYEAARVFASRQDRISVSYSVKCCKIALKNNLEN